MAGLTEQQKKALELDSHISVTASAGSGKTRVLVERYVEAVRSGASVEQILCLTFTEKAALELRQKVIDRINSGLSSVGDLKPEVRGFLRNAKRDMLEANISTIHSFCSQVLREFPIEAGIDANFKVLEDFDSSSLKEEACDDAIRESLAAERPESSDGNVPGAERRAVNDFLVRVGYRRALGLLVTLLDNREKIEHIRVNGKPLVMSEERVRIHWSRLAEAVCGAVRENVKTGKTDLTSDLETLKDALADISVEPGSLLTILQSLLEKILTQKGEPRKRDVSIEDTAARSATEAAAVIRNGYMMLKAYRENSNPTGLPDYLELLKTLLELHDRSDAIYSRKKYSAGALDFDDLQIITLRLLRGNESVRNTLGSRFRHIMVDEFQDTNFLQYDIFLNLLNGFAGDAKLFVVGDPKQSIYRFRNAQVEVSRRAEEDISGLPDGVSVALLDSFRMNSEIASFVNAVFESAMTGDSLFETISLPVASPSGYKPLVARRPGGEGNPVEIFVAEKNPKHESETEEEVEGTGPSASELQALFTASRIRKMISSRELVRTVKTGEQPREITYGDIAVLLRTRSKLTLLEEALSRSGVPYVVSSGIGFYSSQEIFDLTNYLRFLLDNSSDIALLAVLRSPFFGISDNELYRISMSEGAALFEKLRNLAASAAAGDEIKYAASVLSDEIQLAQRLTIPHLINRILERTGWLGAYRLSPTGNQRIANLRKLLSIAREFEGRGFNNLFDFVERIKYLKETAREGQAPVEEAADAVNIMTVHASKGLEFPVVFVPFCDTPSKTSRQLVVNDSVGILPFIGSETPPSMSLYRKIEDMNEQAEIVRLFYVACTRAMDKLVLTTSSKMQGGTAGTLSFTDVLGKSFDLSSPPASGLYEFPGGKMLVRTGIPNGESTPIEKTERSREIGKVSLDPILADTGGEIYSATLLQTFNLCPTKYFLRYRLGMPSLQDGDRRKEKGESNLSSGAESAGSGLGLDDYDDSILSTAKGSLVHAVLEQILSGDQESDEAIESVTKRTVIAGVGQSVTEGARQELVEGIIKNVRNAITTLSEIGSKGKKYFEQTITRRFNSDFLTGTLDLLIEDERGFHIFDYKTDRLDKTPDEIYTGYETQMKLYALLCSNLKPDQDEFDVTIIFTRGPGKYLRKIYQRNELLSFERDIGAMIERIKGLEVEAGNFPPADSLPAVSPHCDECEYFAGERQNECALKRR